MYKSFTKIFFSKQAQILVAKSLLFSNFKFNLKRIKQYYIYKYKLIDLGSFLCLLFEKNHLTVGTVYVPCYRARLIQVLLQVVKGKDKKKKGSPA